MKKLKLFRGNYDGKGDFKPLTLYLKSYKYRFADWKTKKEMKIPF